MVEDNVVNQKVVALLLGSLGYTADFAADGQEAVEAVAEAEESYDVILMDIQMPRLDGLAATRAIRRRDLPSQPRIIAMTAAASQAEQDVCIAAGMDAYLRKPVTIDELEAALEQTPIPADPAAGEAGEGAVDFTVVDRLYALRPEAVLELVRTFLASSSERLAQIADAVAAGDADRLRAVAHSLKGSSSTLGAARLAKICRRLEKLPVAEAGEALRELEREQGQVDAAFQDWLRLWRGSKKSVAEGAG